MKWSYEALLGRLTDMRALAQAAPEGERSGCCSSYDRRSRFDEQTGHYVDWDANDDGSGYVRKLEDGSIVAVELNGPGVIWRCWSAMPGLGNIRIYVDGQGMMDRPFRELFTAFGEDFAPANTPSLCPQLSRGYNSFLPIPFNKSLRIELAPNWGMYYHFTYTCFAPGSEMPDYRDAFTKAGRVALAKLDRALYHRGDAPASVLQANTLAPCEACEVFRQEQQGAIRRMTLRMKNADMRSSRDVILRIYWDGEQQPSVCAPVADFFATTATAGAMRTWACGRQGDTFYATWYMPFSKGARVTLTNLSDEPLTVETGFDCEACPEADSLLRFCAQQHGDDPRYTADPTFAPGGERFPDWSVLDVNQGAGRFCGMHLLVRDTFPYPEGKQTDDWWFGYGGDKRLDWWWGEGDEKFFVDGEKFPSTYGTGSEDYFGYAWAAEPPFALFDSAFAAMSDMPLDGNGDTSVCRIHVADSVPFRQGFAAFLEKYKGNAWGEGCRCEYTVTPYWYQQPGLPAPYAAGEQPTPERRK